MRLQADELDSPVGSPDARSSWWERRPTTPSNIRPCPARARGVRGGRGCGDVTNCDGHTPGDDGAGPLEAALTSVQVSERSDLEPAAGRDTPCPGRFATVRGVPACGDHPRAGRSPRRRAGVRDVDPGCCLVDVVYLRGLWIHRVDLHLALGRPFVATAEHDGRIVADVVAEWARRAGAVRPRLHQGGRPTCAVAPPVADAERLSMDAVAICAPSPGTCGHGRAATMVPFSWRSGSEATVTMAPSAPAAVEAGRVHLGSVTED